MFIEGTDSNSALIWDYVELGQNPENTDFGLLGLDKNNWTITKGRRLYRNYMTPKEEDIGTIEYDEEEQFLVVKDSYEYVRDGIIITSLTRKVEWFNINGVVIFSKNIGINMTDGAIIKLNKEIRSNQIDVARELGANLNLKIEIDELLLHYNPQILEYIEMGNDTFYNSIINETDQHILDLLAIETPATAAMGIPDIKTAMLYQITP